MPEFGVLKGFSDTLANLENYWENSLEEVTSRTQSGLKDRDLGIKRERYWEGTTSSVTSAV